MEEEFSEALMASASSRQRYFQEALKMSVRKVLRSW
jgi:hypothetical protein